MTDFCEKFGNKMIRLFFLAILATLVLGGLSPVAAVKYIAGGGANFDSELGDGSAATSNRRVGVVAVNATGPLSGITVSKICNGGSYSLVLTADNILICWGRSFACASNSTDMPQPLPITLNMTGFGGKNISAISCGSNTAAALTTDGTFFTWGRGENGELANGFTQDVFFPSPVDFSSTPLAGKSIAKFDLGRSHGVLLTTDGLLYSWGFGSSGRLGNGRSEIRLVPGLVDMTPLNGENVTDLAVGDAHNLVLTASGKLFAWGYGFNGALGNGGSSDALSPVPVDQSGALAGKTITKIAAGEQVSLVLATGPNSVVAWGTFFNTTVSGSQGALNPFVVRNSDTLLASETILSIHVQMWHCAVLTASGKVFMWGWQNGVWGDGTFVAREPLSSAATSGILAGKFISHVSPGRQSTHWVYMDMPPAPVAAPTQPTPPSNPPTPTASSIPVRAPIGAPTATSSCVSEVFSASVVSLLLLSFVAILAV